MSETLLLYIRVVLFGLKLIRPGQTRSSFLIKFCEPIDVNIASCATLFSTEQHMLLLHNLDSHCLSSTTIIFKVTFVLFFTRQFSEMIKQQALEIKQPYSFVSYRNII